MSKTTTNQNEIEDMLQEDQEFLETENTVSYTHLTLPTIE